MAMTTQLRFCRKVASRFSKEEENLDDLKNEEILSNKKQFRSILRGYEESIQGKGKLIEL